MSVPYDYITAQRDSATRQHPGSFAAYGLPPRPAVAPVAEPLSPPLGGAPTAPGAPGGIPTFPGMIKSLEAKKGGRLTPEELMDAQSQFGTEILMPANIAKGAKQFELEAIKAAFDAKASRFATEYLAQPGEPGASASNDEDYGLRRGLEVAGDTATGIGSGIASFVPGVLSLVDLAYRYSPVGRGVSAMTKMLAEGVNTSMTDQGIKDRLALMEAPNRTFIGDAAAWLEGQRTQATDALTSQRTLDLRQERNAALPDDDAPFLEQFAAYVGETLKRPSVLSQDIGQGLGSIASPGGAAAKGLKLVEKGAPLAQRIASRFVPAALIGTPQAGVAVTRIEEEIYKRPLAELLESEENKIVFDMLVESGISREGAEERLKDEIARKTMPVVIATELAANVALPALPGLGGAERALTATGRRAGGRALRATTGATSEATQEGLAGVTEQIGENVSEAAQTGQDIPLLAGAGTAAAGSALAGGPVGGIVGGLTPNLPSAAPVVPPANTPAPNTPAAGPAGPAPTPAAPTPTPVTGKGIPQPDLDVALAKIRNGIAVALATKSATSKSIKAAATAPDAVMLAGAYAPTAMGKAWANLDPAQQVAVIEAVATEFVKGKPFAADLPTAMAGLKQASAPAAAPLVTQLPVPPGLINPAPPAAPAPTPQSIPLTRGQPMIPAPAPAPAPTAPTPVAAATPAPTGKPLRRKPPRPPGVDPETGQPLNPPPVVEAAPEPVGKPLPTELSKAAPRYGYGDKNFTLDFESDAEKALYIVRDATKKSKSDAKYLQWIKDNLELNEAEARAAGARVAAYVKGLAGTAATGQTKIRVPTGAAESAPAAEAAPTVAPKPIPAPPIKEGKGLRKKVPPPPKTEAPAPNPVAGAQGPVNPSSAPQPASAASASRESAADAVDRILQGGLTDEDAQPLIEAIELAREGDTARLEEAIKGLELPDGAIGFRKPTHAEKVALREAGKSLKPGERGEAVTDEEPYIVESELEASERVKNAMVGKNALELIDWAAKNGPTPAYRAIAKAVAGAMRVLRDKKDARFSIVGKPLPKGNYGETSSGLTVRAFAAEVRLAINQTQGTSWETLLHEYIHAVTANMMIPATEPRSATYGKARDTKIERAIEELSELNRLVLIHINEQIKLNQGADLPPVVKAGVRGKLGIRKGGPANNALANVDELLAWGMTNEAYQEFLRTIKVGEKTTAWSKFVGFVRNLLGVPEQYESALERLIGITDAFTNVANVEEWADAVAKDGFYQSDAVLTQITRNLDVGSDPFTILNRQEVNALPVSRWQRIGELFANMTYGLERAEQEVRKLGGTVAAEISPYFAGRKFGSDISEIASVDREEIVNPIAKWINDNWGKFADTVDEFHTYSDQFLQAWHELKERVPDQWLQRVPLNNGQNIARDLLIEQAHNGEITPQEFYSQLQDLVNQNASVGLEEWSKTTHGVKALEGLRGLLADLKTRGYDENTLAEYNAIFDPARKRLQEHMLASGRIAASDPWVQARGWKYYFPLKGTNTVSEDVADADYGSYNGKAKEFRSIQIKLAEGRSSFAGSVASQLVSDMHNEGSKLAEKHFKESLFSFVTENLANMGATKITIVRGTLRGGFTREATVRRNGRPVVVQKPVAPERVYTEPTNGFVYHNGDTHFIVDLDIKNDIAGQLDRGVKGIRNVNSPQGFFKYAGMATNVLARAYTTWSPTWQAMVGFLRDTNYIPITLAMEIFQNPLKAGAFARGYAKRLALNTLNTLNAKQTFLELAGRKDLLRAKAKADPDSFMGQLFAFREAGGSTEFNQGLNPDLAYDELFGKAKTKGVGGRLKQGYGLWNDTTSNWAQLLENKGRVAAFSTLVQDMGYAPEEAAALVKSVMDFGQSGQWGRQINSVFAFYRVGATSVDVMRRVFTDPKGNPDWAKLRNWSAFMATGAIAALALSAAALGDDDEGKPRIRKYDVKTLTQKMIVPDGNGGVYSMAIGLGLPQLLMAPGIIGGMVSMGYATPAEGADAMYETITRNLPFQPAGWAKGTGTPGFLNSWAQGFMPTVVRPVTEIVGNVNSFDSPIHTLNYNKNKFRSAQGMEVTPQEWKDMATTIHEWSRGTVDMYPEDIRHMSKGYGGQLVSEVVRLTSEYEAQENAGLDSNPVRTSLRVGVSDESYYYSRELKKTENILLNTRRRSNAADDAGTAQQFNRDPTNARRLAALKELESAKKKYYDELNRIRDANISVQGKRDRRKLADSALRRAVESAQRVVELTQ